MQDAIALLCLCYSLCMRYVVIRISSASRPWYSSMCAILWLIRMRCTPFECDAVHHTSLQSLQDTWRGRVETTLAQLNDEVNANIYYSAINIFDYHACCQWAYNRSCGCSATADYSMWAPLLLPHRHYWYTIAVLPADASHAFMWRYAMNLLVPYSAVSQQGVLRTTKHLWEIGPRKMTFSVHWTHLESKSYTTSNLYTVSHLPLSYTSQKWASWVVSCCYCVEYVNMASNLCYTVRYDLSRLQVCCSVIVSA
jgi:hypothetical protein